MPLTNAPTTWTSITLSQDEIWQCRGGEILTTVETPVDNADNRGIRLHNGQVRLFRSGQTVNYRTLTMTGVEANAALHRELYL